MDEYIEEDSLAHVIDAFVDSLDLEALGFKVFPANTGRPGYHPSTMLKLYIYGYLNRIQSTRRLEIESKRNLELMWLLGRLTPDFKTIADFRKDHGNGIQKTCREFVVTCRKLKLLSSFVAIDGSKFKAVNNGNKNFSKNRVEVQLEFLDKSIQKYLLRLQNSERYDIQPLPDSKKVKLEERIRLLQVEVTKLKEIKKQIKTTGNKQISLVDPDARSMKSKMSGFVGYNVQSSVDTQSHIIVEHVVTNDPSDRSALASTAKKTKEILNVHSLDVVADRGYYNGTEIKECEDNNIKTIVPKTLTSNNRSKGLFDKSAFNWDDLKEAYICPAGELLTYRTSMLDRGKKVKRYWSTKCQQCKLRGKCTTGKERRVSRLEHEEVLDEVEKRLVENPTVMTLRKSTVEHPFGTIKCWMGDTHFKMKRMHHVSTEMSLHVLAYNIKRAIKLLGAKSLIQALAA